MLIHAFGTEKADDMHIVSLCTTFVMGGRGEEYRNCRRMAINTQVQKVCMEEGIGFVDMWLNFVGRGDFFMRDGLHLTGKGAAVLACEFVRVVDEGTGTIDYLN